METIIVNNVSYDIINNPNVKLGTENCQVKKTSHTFIRTTFPIFPICLNGEFRWFKKTKIMYRVYLNLYKDFDDGWSYKYFWSNWTILNKKEKFV